MPNLVPIENLKFEMETNNPDSPDSLASDQLTVDLLSPRANSKRRRVVISDIDVERRDGTPDIKNNNNDVGFVLMDNEHHENGTEDDNEVCI